MKSCLSPGLLLVLTALDPGVARHVVGVGRGLVGALLVGGAPHVGRQRGRGRPRAGLHVCRERRVGWERTVVGQAGEEARVGGWRRQEGRGEAGHVFSSIGQESGPEHGLGRSVLTGRELLESLHVVLVWRGRRGPGYTVASPSTVARPSKAGPCCVSRQLLLLI